MKIKLVATLKDFDQFVDIISKLPDDPAPVISIEIQAVSKGVTLIFDGADDAYKTALMLAKPPSERDGT